MAGSLSALYRGRVRRPAYVVRRVGIRCLLAFQVAREAETRRTTMEALDLIYFEPRYKVLICKHCCSCFKRPSLAISRRSITRGRCCGGRTKCATMKASSPGMGLRSRYERSWPSTPHQTRRQWNSCPSSWMGSAVSSATQASRTSAARRTGYEAT